MSEQFTQYNRRQFRVTAARVSVLNIEELARWTNGVLCEGDKDGQLSRYFIKVRTGSPSNSRIDEAHVGDWIVKRGRQFQVYSDRAFRKTFENMDGSDVAEIEERAAVSPNNMPKQRPAQKPADASPVETVAPADPGTVQENKPEDPNSVVMPDGTEILDPDAGVTITAPIEGQQS